MDKPTLIIKYCDRCKWDEDVGSKFIPEGIDAEDMTECPICGRELYESSGREDIP